MRKFRLVVVAFAISLLAIPLAYADCDVTETNKLSSLANNVNSSQEIIQKEVKLEEGYNTPDGLTDEELENYLAKRDYFRVSIYNVTEELYIEVTDNNTKETKRYNYEDAINGTISFEKEVGTEITNYTVIVYASDKTGCVTRKLRTFYIELPMYNLLSESSLCEGIKEFYMCHEYLNVEVNFTKFEESTQLYREGKLKDDGSEKGDDKNNEGFLGFLKEHKGVVIITSIGIIAIGGLVTMIIVKKQRSRIV